MTVSGRAVVWEAVGCGFEKRRVLILIVSGDVAIAGRDEGFQAPGRLRIAVPQIFHRLQDLVFFVRSGGLFAQGFDQVIKPLGAGIQPPT